MPNLFNSDFKDFLEALNNAQVDYILVGGYAVIKIRVRRSLLFS